MKFLCFCSNALTTLFLANIVTPSILSGVESSEEGATIEVVEEDPGTLKNMPTFDSFSNQHILDPAMFVNVSTLTAAELNLIVGQRAGIEQAIAPGGSDLRKKSIHIFLTGNPEEVKSSFHKGPYTTIFNESIPITNTGISDRPFPTILLHKKGHSPRRPYNAWACGSKYIVAGLNRVNEPIYLQGVQDSPSMPFPWVTAPGLNPADCTRVP